MEGEGEVGEGEKEKGEGEVGEKEVGYERRKKERGRWKGRECLREKRERILEARGGNFETTFPLVKPFLPSVTFLL